MASTTSDPGITARRHRACQSLMRQAHVILDQEGSTPSALHALKTKLAALAARAELFPTSEFPLPLNQGRLHTLLVEPDDGLALPEYRSYPSKRL